MAIGEALQYGYSGTACCGQITPPAPVTCTPCEAGKYSSASGTARGASYFSTCTPCPSHSTSPTGSSNATQCQCNAGYTAPNGANCIACGAGKYKSTTGSESCTVCTASPGSFCSVASVSAGGVSCSPGFYCTGGASDRTPCPPNTYSKTAGASSVSTCIACQTGKNSGAGASHCTSDH